MRINPVIKIGQKFNEGSDIALIRRGEDKYIYDSKGKKYLDFCGGIWNIPFGYTNPIINKKWSYVNILDTKSQTFFIIHF